MSDFSIEEIRKKFIDYFVNHNHSHIPASSLIPYNDPSLMFVNSGMVQFKNVFTGDDKRDYTRATTSQKSIRAGGKHNDLENVGYTARHHTFFEMLGNFSFGDYFKEEAIFYSWDFLTNQFKIPKKKLYVTVHHLDDEAFVLWKKIAELDDSRIIRIKTNDNFWSMGATGPCGPCSEIFYDHGNHISGGLPGTSDENGDRFVEIWNMVFMQYQQLDNDIRIDLPKKSIDTGMGLERIAAVMQNVYDNYDIDLFQKIISFIESIVRVKPIGNAKFSYRIISDHLRSCVFLISDGIIPSNEGRGYVLRRIMRRSMRHVHLLGQREPLLYRLVPKLVELMGSTYPELYRSKDFIIKILKEEEIRFQVNLERGLKLLDESTTHLGKDDTLSGVVAFKLYDTYGFPLDLTSEILKSRDIFLDYKGFEEKMQEQRERARNFWIGSGEKSTDKLWFEILSRFGATEFVGYTFTKIRSKILALVKDSVLIESQNVFNEQFIIIVNQTTFYPESGGQIGDIGYIKGTKYNIKVINTFKYLDKLIAHVCLLESGMPVSVGDIVDCIIDVDYRNDIKKQHSSTHILHSVLREIYGNHVVQKGSLITRERLRFDIAHTSPISLEELLLIEDKVNNVISSNALVSTSIMSYEKSIEMGAIGLFGERYENEVRVISIENINNSQKESFSLELCGGTHVSNTSEIGLFKILNTCSIASGVRRIEATCGRFVWDLIRKNDLIIKELSSILNVRSDEILIKANELILSKKELLNSLTNLQVSRFTLSEEEISSQSRILLSVRLFFKLVNNIDNNILCLAAKQLVDKSDNLIVVYVNNSSTKLVITVATSKGISDKFYANVISQKISIFLGGRGGGGSARFAQAGGNDRSKIIDLEAMLVSSILEMHK